MTTFVVDTNVIVSGVLFPASKPGRVLDLLLDGRLNCVASVELLSEYRDILKRPKSGLDAGQVDLLVDGIEGLASVIVPRPQSTVLSDDPKDQFVIDLAVCASAYIVTGNTKHFASYPKTLSPSELLTMLAK